MTFASCVNTNEGVTNSSVEARSKNVKDIGIDKLSNSLADTLSHRLLESLEVEKLANTVFERYADELQEAIVTAIISKM